MSFVVPDLKQGEIIILNTHLNFLHLSTEHYFALQFSIEDQIYQIDYFQYPDRTKMFIKQDSLLKMEYEIPISLPLNPTNPKESLILLQELSLL